MAGCLARFGVLGPLVFERDGQPVALASGRQRSLLALLLLSEGAPVSRDRLIDELWGEQPPASAVSALHVHLSKLRGLLGGLLSHEAAGYALDPSAYELDARRFDALIGEARSEPERAGALLREALGLFRSEPLCDVDSEGDVAAWRRTLEEKRLHATTLRIDDDLAAGAAGELVGELERLTGQHPYEERLWGQLILALYRAGRQADALETYARTRRLLVTELGLEPGGALIQLHQGILERDPTLLVTPSAPAATAEPGGRPSVSMLPRPLTRLVGRDRELAALTGLMADPGVRMLTLTGPGGVGKTRLLLELARREETRYEDGAVFVRLEQLTDPALVAAEIASALAVRDASDGPGADGLAEFLRSRNLLLAVDNFEHLLGAAVLLAELLSLAPGLRVIASSRTALRIRGEYIFEVEPLAVPADAGASEVSASPAVELFLQCAQAANRRLVLDPSRNVTVAAICRALDGLPLGIELAASRAHLLSLEQIAAQLAQPLRIRGRALRDLPDRQQTLEATIRWSYDLLTSGAQEVLRCAAVFLGGLTLSALEAVLGRSTDGELDELVEASLVRMQPQAGRLELLELVRAFGLDELELSGQALEIRRSHRRHFVARVRAASEAFDAGAGPGDLAVPLQADHPNLRAAVEDAIEAGDGEAAQTLALGLRPLWLAGMQRQEAQELVERLLERFEIPGDVEVRLLRTVAFVNSFSPSAISWNRRLAARAADVGDHEALVMATCNLFGQAFNTHDRDEVDRLRPQLVALLTHEANRKSVAWIHYFLALDAYVNGQLRAAYEHACLSADQAAAVGHDFLLASAVATRLLSQSARDEVITHAALTETLALMCRPSLKPLAVFGLWFVARYAAAVAPEEARRWLAHAERTLAQLDTDLWPESVLRVETTSLLGITDLEPLLEATPVLDHNAALREAMSWLAARDPAEAAPRAGALCGQV